MGHAMFWLKGSRWRAWLLVMWAGPDQGVINKGGSAGSAGRMGMEGGEGLKNCQYIIHSPSLPFIKGQRKTPSCLLSGDLTQMLILHSHLAKTHWSSLFGNEIEM